MERVVICQVITSPFSMRMSLIEASLLQHSTFPLFLQSSKNKNQKFWTSYINTFRRMWKAEIGKAGQLGTWGHSSLIEPRQGAEEMATCKHGEKSSKKSLLSPDKVPGNISLARQETFRFYCPITARHHRGNKTKNKTKCDSSLLHPHWGWVESLEFHPDQAVTRCPIPSLC